MKKVLLVVIMLTVSITFAGTTFAAKKKGYAEGTAGAGSITGVVSLKGAATVWYTHLTLPTNDSV